MRCSNYGPRSLTSIPRTMQRWLWTGARLHSENVRFPSGESAEFCRRESSSERAGLFSRPVAWTGDPVCAFSRTSQPSLFIVDAERSANCSLLWGAACRSHRPRPGFRGGGSAVACRSHGPWTLTGPRTGGPPPSQQTPNAVLMLRQRRRRWPNIRTTLGRTTLFAGLLVTDRSSLNVTVTPLTHILPLWIRTTVSSNILSDQMLPFSFALKYTVLRIANNGNCSLFKSAVTAVCRSPGCVTTRRP